MPRGTAGAAMLPPIGSARGVGGREPIQGEAWMPVVVHRPGLAQAPEPTDTEILEQELEPERRALLRAAKSQTLRLPALLKDADTSADDLPIECQAPEVPELPEEPPEVPHEVPAEVPAPPGKRGGRGRPAARRRQRPTAAAAIAAAASARLRAKQTPADAQLSRVAAALSQLRWHSSKGRSQLEVAPEGSRQANDAGDLVSVPSASLSDDSPAEAAPAGRDSLPPPNSKEVRDFRQAVQDVLASMELPEQLESTMQDIVALIASSSPGISGRFVVFTAPHRLGLEDLVHGELRRRLAELSEVVGDEASEHLWAHDEPDGAESMPCATGSRRMSAQPVSWRDRAAERRQRLRRQAQAARKRHSIDNVGRMGTNQTELKIQAPIAQQVSEESKTFSVFTKMQKSANVQQDDLTKALDLLGFNNVNPNRVDQVRSGITHLPDLRAEEFGAFVQGFRELQRNEYAEEFNRFDVDNSGSVNANEIILILRHLGHDTMMHVLQELIAEVDKSGAGELDLIQFETMVELLRSREGFCKSEHDRFLYAFHTFDKDKSGTLSTAELSDVLRWLDYNFEHAWLAKTVKEVDIDGSGTLNTHEFLVCMRKFRERQVAQIKSAIEIHDEDNDGTIRGAVAYEVLRTLGYPAEAECVNDAIRDCGFQPDVDGMLDLNMLWQVYELYRVREGFSSEETAEIDRAFVMFDADQSGEISTLETRKIMRWLGCFLSWEVQQDLLALVDLDQSGAMDLAELRKLNRLCRHSELQTAREVFEEADIERAGVISKASACAALQKLGCHYDRKQVAKATDIETFIQLVKQGKKAMLAKYRENHCFTDAELEKMAATFYTFDADGSGDIVRQELFQLLDSECPVLARDKERRPMLVKLMQEVAPHANSNALDFQSYVRLRARLRDMQDSDRLLKEQSALRETGFSRMEAREFRQIFLAADTDGDGELTLEEARNMIARICPMGVEHHAEFASIFKEVSSRQWRTEGSSDHADYPEFLFLMRKILDDDFANVSEKTRGPDDGTRSRRSRRRSSTARGTAKALGASIRASQLRAGGGDQSQAGVGSVPVSRRNSRQSTGTYSRRVSTTSVA